MTAQKDPLPSGEYTWPVHLIWVISAVIYLEAGLSKLRHSGISWVTTNIMRSYLMRAYYHVSDSEPLAPWGLWIAQSRHLSSLFAAGAVMLEVGFVIALFSRRSRWVLVPGVVAMQTGIAVLMGPNFYQMIMCQAMWVPWDRVVSWLAGRLTSWQKLGNIAAYAEYRRSQLSPSHNSQARRRRRAAKGAPLNRCRPLSRRRDKCPRAHLRRVAPAKSPTEGMPAPYHAFRGPGARKSSVLVASALFLALCIGSIRTESVTSNETVHIPAGLSYWQKFEVP